MYSCLSYDNLLYSITLWCNWKTVSVKGPRTLRNALFWVSLCPMISNSPVQAVEIILKWKNYTIQFNSLVIETYYSKVFCRAAENYGIIWCTLFVHICGIKLANFSAVIYRNKFKIMGTMKCLIIYFSGHSHKNHIQLSDQFIIITGASARNGTTQRTMPRSSLQRSTNRPRLTWILFPLNSRLLLDKI